MKKNIYLQKIGLLSEVIVKKLKKNLEWAFKQFGLGVKILPNEFPLLDIEFHTNRRQFDAGKIMRRLNNHMKNKDYFRVLGVMNEDIYSGLLNFVFGIANMPKNYNFGLALISVTRLSEKFYRRPENLAVLELRILKEAIHELGHTFGLEHCSDFCVMQFSNCLNDTDSKPPKFCSSCLTKLNFFFKNLN